MYKYTLSFYTENEKKMYLYNMNVPNIFLQTIHYGIIFTSGSKSIRDKLLVTHSRGNVESFEAYIIRQ